MNGKISYLPDILGFKEFAIFCGAGISKNSGLPLANEVKKYILETLPIEKEDIKEIMASNLPFEAFIETISENTDISKILEIFERGEPNTNHILIARLAKNGYLKTILTTNFDLLIEKALEKEGLRENKDFQVYYDEEQFSGIDLEDIKDKVIRIFKIHGSVDSRDSIRTTMKAVASNTFSDKRMKVISYLFSTGIHKKVLILGYSCSDEFDITPGIQSIGQNQKEIILVEHYKEGKEIEDIRIQEEKNPFKMFPGSKIKCNTDEFVRNLWDSFRKTIEIGEYELIESTVNWRTHLDDWVNGIREEYLKYSMVGLILYVISNFKRAIQYYEKVLEIGKAIGDEVIQAAGYGTLGTAYFGLRNFETAIQYYKKSLEIVKTIKPVGDKEGEAACCIGLGQAYCCLGDFKAAIRYLDKSLEIVKVKADRNGEAVCYANLGDAYRSLGDFKRAIEYHEKCLKFVKAIGEKSGEAQCYTSLGAAYKASGNPKRATEYYEKSLEIAKVLGEKSGEGACYFCLGDAYYDSGHFNRAIEYLLKAQKIFTEIEQIRNLQEVYRILALAYDKIGNNDKAEDYKRKLSSDIRIL